MPTEDKRTPTDQRDYYSELFANDLYSEEPNDTENEDTARQMNDETKLSDIVLPDGLQRRVLKQYGMAIAVALFSIVLCVVYKEPTYLCGLIITGVLIYLGIETKLDFAAGKIMEIPVICASVNAIAVRKSMRVVFRSNDEFPTYYEFIVPGKDTSRINPNFAYIIYFDPNKPKELLGYTPI